MTSISVTTTPLSALCWESEADIVQAAVIGNNDAFSLLVRKYYERALSVAQKIVGSRDEAQDVVQEAFVKAHGRLGEFQGQSGFYTWLYRIVANLSIDTLRKRKRERRADIEQEDVREALRNGTHETLWPSFDDTNPAMNAERRELRQRLQRVFEQLSDIHQDVIMLREVQGQSYEEIAGMLGIKKGTVMSRLFHARRAMQNELHAPASIQ